MQSGRAARITRIAAGSPRSTRIYPGHPPSASTGYNLASRALLCGQCGLPTVSDATHCREHAAGRPCGPRWAAQYPRRPRGNNAVICSFRGFHTVVARSLCGWRNIVAQTWSRCEPAAANVWGAVWDEGKVFVQFEGHLDSPAFIAILEDYLIPEGKRRWPTSPSRSAAGTSHRKGKTLPRRTQHPLRAPTASLASVQRYRGVLVLDQALGERMCPELASAAQGVHGSCL